MGVSSTTIGVKFPAQASLAVAFVTYELATPPLHTNVTGSAVIDGAMVSDMEMYCSNVVVCAPIGQAGSVAV